MKNKWSLREKKNVRNVIHFDPSIFEKAHGFVSTKRRPRPWRHGRRRLSRQCSGHFEWHQSLVLDLFILTIYHLTLGHVVVIWRFNPSNIGQFLDYDRTGPGHRKHECHRKPSKASDLYEESRSLWNFRTSIRDSPPKSRWPQYPENSHSPTCYLAHRNCAGR